MPKPPIFVTALDAPLRAKPSNDPEPFATRINGRRKPSIKLLTLAVLLIAATAHAATIYRWVDDKGRTHLSDVVPEKYKKSAKRVDTRQHEVSPQRQKEAQERAAKDKAAADEAAKQRAATASAPAASAPPASAPIVKRPAQGVTDTTDCATWWRLYRESQECFGPFHTVHGGLKPEAFEHCNEIPSPVLKCGPWRD